MNEQAINNITAYFQQYPDAPPEQLVQNILQAGYKMPDLVEALRRQGISPIVIPGYVEPEPPPPKPFPIKLVIFGFIGMVILVLMGGMIYWVKSQQPISKEEKTKGTLQQAVITDPNKMPLTPIPSPTPQPESQTSEPHHLYVQGNVLVDVVAINDGKIKHTGYEIVGLLKQEIPGITYTMEDNNPSGIEKTIFNTTVSGLSPDNALYFDISFLFRDAGKAQIKLVGKSDTDKKWVVIFHDISEKGFVGKIHFIPTDDPHNINLVITDPSSGANIKMIQPDEILDSEKSEDITPPKTTISTVMQSGKEVLVLTATDDLSGIYKTEYSFDNGQTVQIYKDPIPLDTISTRTIDFTSTDKAGNVEPLTKENF